MARTIGVIALGLIVFFGIVGTAFLVEMNHHFHPPAPISTSTLPENALDAQRQDLRYFRQLIALDRSFSAADRAEANRRLVALEALDTGMDKAHFRTSLMLIDALADNGHSRVENDGRASSPELPIRVAAFSDGLYIMRATDASADLLGSRVTAVDGQPVDTVMAKLQLLHGGAPQWRRLLASQDLISQDLLYGVDVAPDLQHSNWTVETLAGKTITRRLEALTLPRSEPSVAVTRWLSSERIAGMEEHWQTFEPEHALPLSLTSFDIAFRSLPVPETCTYFVQLKSNADQGGLSIKAFLASTDRQLRQARPCNVILDLRYNSGGDYLNTYRFARNLPTLIPPEGKVILLTGPATFSAGITTAAFVKHADPGRVLILGEPVGDRLQFFSEGGRACLPNYPLCVAYETGKHDYQHACTDWDLCFWLNYFVQFRVKSLDPDEIVPMSFTDWRAGVDPVLERALALTTASSPGKQQRD